MTGALAFFGAFNPPTAAHIGLARFAMEQTGAGQVIFVPSKSIYISKSQGKELVYPDETRLNMLRRAAESRPWMRVTDRELLAPAQPRTYEPLCHFREEGVTPALLMGSDKLPELEHGWLHVEEIVREFGIVCLARGGDESERLLRDDPYLRRLSGGIRVLETPEKTRFVSSTAVRERVARIRELEAQLREMVPAEILPLL